jgi:rRNA maturation endonuclease Nob1
MNYIYTEESILKHHGIRGQKWGKHNGPPYPLSDAKHNSVVKKSKRKTDVKKMSDEELEKKVRRLNLEKKYKDLKTSDYYDKKKYASDVLKSTKKISDATQVIDKTGISKGVSAVLDGSSKAINNSKRKKQTKIDASNISDTDLKKYVKRMELEKKYNELTDGDIKTGREKVLDILDVAGGIAGMAASAYIVYNIAKNIKMKK